MNDNVIRPEFTEEMVRYARTLPPSQPEIDWEERALTAEKRLAAALAELSYMTARAISAEGRLAI